MKKLKIVMSYVMLTAILSSCVYTKPSADINPRNHVEEIFTVSDFHSVDFGHAFIVEIVSSTESRITINGDKRDVEDIRIHVQDRKLIIDYGNSGWLANSKRHQVEILIETASLRAAEISGAANVSIDHFDFFPMFNLDLSGASQLQMNVPAEEFNMDISGASRLKVYRETQIIRADLSGASHLDAYNASAEKAYLDLSGASSASITVNEYLYVDASGASSVNYRGNPDVDQNTSGGSNVSKK